ncbi:polysaccharide deacetylase family protein [Adhaeribacter radiodurans]|uniref:DUF7033 domain-containing protein n=1 Tax=Adhaeribacter radiodurans TaxID=2745197 RepID=A0A7L7L8Z5_9BACT|nr:polysaccharide deacetylase family protein [Adhaeribacter radiodurans]QMU28985.1 hypothetical protein HUW48_13460 [Adhaeribacter radiodurans]
MEAIFKYVLAQFYNIYSPQQSFEIHYGLNNQSRIQITQTKFTFFEQTAPFPETPPTFYTWKNQKIPFWFGAPEVKEIITYVGDQAVIKADIIANAFYFLSGWQEYYSTQRDNFGRFPYAESLQSKYDFITIPVVNYYFDILKTAIEQVYGLKLISILAHEAPFTTCLTHDIDNCQTAWRVEGIQALKQGKWSRFSKLLKQKISGQDNWCNVPEVIQEVQKYNVTSTFFFLANNRKYKGIANADYDISQSRYHAWLPLLKQKKFEVGIHGSHITSFTKNKLQTEVKKLKLPVHGNRFHYLRFEPQITPQLLEEAGMNYDTTLGFSEHFGFRHGTCFPFQLFNFKKREAFRFFEVPLHLMDATLHHPKYLQLSASEILPAITPMLQEIKKFGGCFTWLWHNENFSIHNLTNGPLAFHQIMEYLQEQGSGFKTISAVVNLLEHPSGQVFSK